MLELGELFLYFADFFVAFSTSLSARFFNYSDDLIYREITGCIAY